MTKVTCDMSVSVDGYTAGLRQSAELPFGEEAFDRLTGWMTQAREENAAELDAIVASGAFVMGRNMFDPGRGDWDLSWRGWWGEEPPYHAPVFVLTHHPREPLEMAGGTTFTFVTDGIHAALDAARAAAGDADVAIAGGAQTVNQYLAAGLIDELRLHVTPAIIGAGERLFEGVPPTDLKLLGARATDRVTHLRYGRAVA